MNLPERNGKDNLISNKGGSSMVKDVSYPPELLQLLREIFPDFHSAQFRADRKSGEGYLAGDVDTSYYRHHEETDVDCDTVAREVASQEGILDLNCHPAAKGFEAAITTGNLQIIALSTVRREKEVPNLEAFVAHICKVVTDRIQDGFYYIVVFPESFFNFLTGNPKKPLSSDQVDRIISSCKEGLKKENVIWSFCFLEEIQPPTSRPWLGNWKVPEHIEQLKDFTSRCLEDYGYDHVGKHIDDKNVHVANYNVFYWKEQALAFYRKSVYLEEVDHKWKTEKRLTDICYEWGDWQTHVIDERCDLAKHLFGGTKPIILPRICGDLNPPANRILFKTRRDVQSGCSPDHQKAMRKHTKELTMKLQAAKLVLVSARRAPTDAISRISAKMPDKSMVVVDSEIKEQSEHRLGGESTKLHWDEIPAHQDYPDVVVFIGTCTIEKPKSSWCEVC